MRLIGPCSSQGGWGRKRTERRRRRGLEEEEDEEHACAPRCPGLNPLPASQDFCPATAGQGGRSAEIALARTKEYTHSALVPCSQWGRVAALTWKHPPGRNKHAATGPNIDTAEASPAGVPTGRNMACRICKASDLRARKEPGP